MSLLAAFRTTLRCTPPFQSTIRLMSTQYTNILVSRPAPSVALITLNRPKALNALSSQVMEEVNQAISEVDHDDEVGAVVLTGSDRAFAGMPDI